MRRLGPFANLDQVLLEPLDRIAARPMIGLIRRPILRRVVARRMRISPISHKLYERRPAAAPRPLDRPRLGRVHGQEVVAVDAQARQSISVRPRGKRGPASRQIPMRADRPLIIDHMQHARRPKHRREIQRVMKVALRRSSIADPGADCPSLAAIRKRHRRPDRLRQLRADRARDRYHISGPPTVMHRHLPTLGVVARVADRLAHHREHRHAANQQHTRLAITRKQQVVANVSRGAGDRHGFFAVAGKVERQSPLALHRDHPRIEDAAPASSFRGRCEVAAG